MNNYFINCNHFPDDRTQNKPWKSSTISAQNSQNKWSVIAYLCPCFQLCCGLLVPESSCAASPFTRVIELWWKRKGDIGNHLLKENDNLSQALLEIVMRTRQHCRLTIRIELVELTNSETAATTPSGGGARSLRSLSSLETGSGWRFLMN